VVLRLAAGLVLAYGSITILTGGPAFAPAAVAILQFVLAILLLAGLWTPLAGLLVALIQVGRLFSPIADLRVHLLLAALGLALALVGPGAWSIDARLFGWRRIDLRDRQSRPHPFKG
jgi:uncharacterized membrane protein YphA (DoxX/SURF4 family)